MLIQSLAGEHGTFGAFGAFGAAKKNPNVERLQRALVALGKKVNDKILVVAVDGLIGKNTAAAVNRAFAAYVGSPPAGTRSTLTQAQIVASAAAMAATIEAEIARRPAKPAVPVAAKPPAAAKPKADPKVARLQKAVVALGKKLGDKSLAIKVDGLIGKNTTNAVNRILAMYLTQAPALSGAALGRYAPAWTATRLAARQRCIAAGGRYRVRTGRCRMPGLRDAFGAAPVLTQAQVVSNAAALTLAIEAEVARRPVAAVKPSKPATPVKPKGDPAVFKLQTALVALGTVRNDSTLANLVQDGIMGTNTQKATNRALVMYGKGWAPANLTTGTLTQAQVKSNAAVITAAVENIAMMAPPSAEPSYLAPAAPSAEFEPGVAPGVAPSVAPSVAPGAVPGAPSIPSQQMKVCPGGQVVPAESECPGVAVAPGVRPSVDVGPAAERAEREALVPAAPEAKPFPTMLVVGLGLGAVALVGVTLALRARGKAPTPAPRLAPAPAKLSGYYRRRR